MAAMDPTIKALSFIKRVTAKTIDEAANQDKLMLIDLWERELMAVRQKLVIPAPALAEAEQRGFGAAAGKP